MITIFAIPKPFIGVDLIHQRNAILSWKHVCNKVQIILYGDEEGIEKIASECNLIHIPDVRKNKFGTPYLNDIFLHVQSRACSDYICYLNCDIILASDPELIINKIPFSNFLISGRRTSLDVPDLIDYNDSNGIQNFMDNVLNDGILDSPYSMDYFIFPKNQINIFPQFVVGRMTWDVWMIWAHKHLFQVPVIDATLAFTIIHQNHGYGHISSGSGFYSGGIESDENSSQFKNESDKFYNILDADYIIDTQQGLIRRDRDLIVLLHRVKRRVLTLCGEKNYKKIKRIIQIIGFRGTY